MVGFRLIAADALGAAVPGKATIPGEATVPANSAGYFGSIQVDGADPLVVLQVARFSLDGDLPDFQDSPEQV